MFAEISPETFAGMLVAGLTALVILINQGDEFLERRKSKAGSPPNEQLQQSVKALEDRLAKLETAHDDIREAMRTDTSEILTKGEERAAKLHERMNPVIENLAFIKGQNEAFTTSFNNLAAVLVAQGKQKS